MDKFVVSLGNVYGREPLSVVYHGKWTLSGFTAW